MTEPPRYPGYDVLAKRDTPSWNAKTREVIEQRLATPDLPRFFSAEEWAIADALCRRILPQTDEADPVSLVALLDAKLLADHGDGFREASMPYMRELGDEALPRSMARQKRGMTAGALRSSPTANGTRCCGRCKPAK